MHLQCSLNNLTPRHDFVDRLYNIVVVYIEKTEAMNLELSRPNN